MKSKYEPITPAVPPSFFSSLTPEQQKEFKQILHAYRLHYASYYDYSGKLIKENGFISYMFSVELWKEVIIPSGMTKNMFILLMYIYFIGKSKKFKGELITIKLIIDNINILGPINRLWPLKNLRYLVKYGWVNYYAMAHNKRKYYISEKGIDLITKYNLAFQRYFNAFFEPLAL